MKEALLQLLIVISMALSGQELFAQEGPAGDIKPIAPYSPALMTETGLLFISGQIPIDPESGELTKGDIEVETSIVMERIGSLLAKYDMEYDDLVKCTVFLTDIRDYQAVNKVYGGYFGDRYPAREAIEVANLPFGASIEISGIAVKR
jgi:2-iminobutanoate/2-iminopropanoate deaminase